MRALGQEPGWRLDITPSGMTLVTDNGARRYETPAATVTRTAEGLRYPAASGDTDISATVVDRLCRDSMSGMPHPYTVAVRAGERNFQGCGGQPAPLLRGGEWIVEDLDGGGIIDRSRASLLFADGGQLSGRASCNTYTARYALSGEGLTFGDATVTRKACAPSLMAQEERFLATLRAVRSFDFTSDCTAPEGGRPAFDQGTARRLRTARCQQRVTCTALTARWSLDVSRAYSRRRLIRQAVIPSSRDLAGHLAMTAEGYNGASLGERSNKQTNFAGHWRRQA